MSSIEEAVEWITEGQVEAFRADYSVVESQFPSLSDEDKQVLKIIHEKGLKEWDEQNNDVVAQGPSSTASARSYGW